MTSFTHIPKSFRTEALIGSILLTGLMSLQAYAQTNNSNTFQITSNSPNILYVNPGSGNNVPGAGRSETKVRQEKISIAVVGVGINWFNPVPATGINLQSFLGDRKSITCQEMLAALTLQGIASGHQCLQAGIDALLPSYHQLLTSIGKQVTVDGRTGVVVGITPQGDLRIKFDTNRISKSTENSEIYLKPGAISLGYDC